MKPEYTFIPTVYRLVSDGVHTMPFTDWDLSGIVSFRRKETPYLHYLDGIIQMGILQGLTYSHAYALFNIGLDLAEDMGDCYSWIPLKNERLFLGNKPVIIPKNIADQALNAQR